MQISPGNFTRLDSALGQFFGQRAQLREDQKIVFQQLVARLNNALGQGHSCIEVNGQEQGILEGSGLVSSDQRTPLILEQDRLYFYRYWNYEKRLAEQILKLSKQTRVWPNKESVIARYFPESLASKDYQREAVASAIGQSFSIITGGPGTGKTTTIVKLLALLLELSEDPLNIALVAPTGKAAMRLEESVVQNKQCLPSREEIKNKIPEVVTTIHRLLGARPSSPYFVHDGENPLPYDLVVVDEASMVDLALMSKLVDALHPHARIVLLGDKDQLASVESGAVLADLTKALPRHAHVLHKAYRFNSGIKALADAVNQQDMDLAWTLLADPQKNNTSLLDQDLIEFIVSKLQDYWQLITNGAEFAQVFHCFNQFQVLCVNRQGTKSVSDINHQVEKRLMGHDSTNQWYIGKPVMITRNHAGMQLYNGDIGICLADKEYQNRLMVFFQRPDGSVKKILPTRLPRYETVFAMTIHKSQGSEFEEVLMVLPDRMNPVLTKELLYTAITRARERVRVLGSWDIFSSTLSNKVSRKSGLEQRLGDR